MSFALNLSFIMLKMWSFLLIDAKFVDSSMKPSVAIQHIVLTFFFLFFIGQKGAVTLARIKPLPDTTVICSGKGFFPFDWCYL